MELKNEKCIEVMKSLKTNSIDFIIEDSVLFAATRLNKNLVGFELDNEYYEQCKRILKND